jgi:hypothetical protein
VSLKREGKKVLEDGDPEGQSFSVAPRAEPLKRNAVGVWSNGMTVIEIGNK